MANADSTQNPTTVSDIALYLKGCSDTFGHLEAILMTIEKQSEEFSSIKKLAGAGVHIARDFENLANCWQGEIERNGVLGVNHE